MHLVYTGKEKCLKKWLMQSGIFFTVGDKDAYKAISSICKQEASQTKL